MNDIKFRAWDGEQMIYDTTPYAKLPDNKILCIGKNGYNRDADIQTSFDCEAINVMQYTGLKDRDGKEIYEGDICYTESKEYPAHKVVIWNDSMACFEFDKVLGKSLLSRESIKVIGNIYENSKIVNP